MQDFENGIWQALQLQDLPTPTLEQVEGASGAVYKFECPSHFSVTSKGDCRHRASLRPISGLVSPGWQTGAQATPRLEGHLQRLVHGLHNLGAVIDDAEDVANNVGVVSTPNAGGPKDLRLAWNPMLPLPHSGVLRAVVLKVVALGVRFRCFVVCGTDVAHLSL